MSLTSQFPTMPSAEKLWKAIYKNDKKEIMTTEKKENEVESDSKAVRVKKISQAKFYELLTK